jgi:NAD(P)-dependent dehydrogenase (short-subunit alcohol dehydrogenase family)
MTGRFAGKVAVVTGGGMSGDVTGIGAAISILLARGGATVGVVDRDEAAAQRTVDILAQDGAAAFGLIGDATREEECARFVQETVARGGGLDILVNNLGVTGVRKTAAIPDPWAFTMTVNLDATRHMTRYGVEAMLEGGAIVNVSSTAAVVQIRGNAQGSPRDERPTFGPGSAYAVSKGAVETLTLATAAQCGRFGIRANCVRPGEVWTAMVERLRENPQEWREERRLRSALRTEGTAWDIAHAVAFLASDEARWITGQVITVDGGMALLR